MNATAGHRIVVESERLARPARRGVIDQILRLDPPRYRVNWDDGRTSIISPASGAAHVEVLDRDRLLGESSDLCRAVNERIHELERSWAGEHDFVCECADDGCTQVMRMDWLEYEALRADDAQFAVLPGHEHAGSEDVILRTDRYMLVRKRDRVGVGSSEA